MSEYEVESTPDAGTNYDSEEAIAVAEPEENTQPECDIDPEEILSCSFLETIEEASESARLLAPSLTEFDLGNDRPRATRRSRRSRRDNVELDPETSARRAKKQKQARFIIYSGLIGLVLLVAIVASWKLPMVLHRFEVIDSPRIPPWTWILGEYNANANIITIEQQQHQLKNGSTITHEKYLAVLEEAGDAVNAGDSIFFTAEEKYKEAMAEGVSDEDRNRMLKETLELLLQAKEKVEPVLPTLEENQGPRKITNLLERANELLQDAQRKIYDCGKQQTL